MTATPDIIHSRVGEPPPPHTGGSAGAAHRHGEPALPFSILMGKRLRALGYADYQEYLHSTHWREVRIRYRHSHLPQDCHCCGAAKVQLHHTTYERIGREKLTDLVPLCAPCHNMVHVLHRRGDITLDLHGLTDGQRAKAHQAQAAADALRRRLEEQADYEKFKSLPLHEQLEQTVRLAKAKRVDIAEDLRAIAHRVERMERKVKRLE